MGKVEALDWVNMYVNGNKRCIINDLLSTWVEHHAMHDPRGLEKYNCTMTIEWGEILQLPHKH